MGSAPSVLRWPKRPEPDELPAAVVEDLGLALGEALAAQYRAGIEQRKPNTLAGAGQNGSDRGGEQNGCFGENPCGFQPKSP